VRQLLVQLARNAVVHGIEKPEIRRRRGKAEMGTFQFALRQHERYLELIFQDDGRGLDLEKIRRRARQMGREVPDGALPDLIFEGGFSTAESTTQDAGRGVGMDLVKSLVEAEGGTLRPHFQPEAWCAFQVLLPALPPTSEEAP
jgi:chemotaxis protein histidine kinase CheA